MVALIAWYRIKGSHAISLNFAEKAVGLRITIYCSHPVAIQCLCCIQLWHHLNGHHAATALPETQTGGQGICLSSLHRCRWSMHPCCKMPASDTLCQQYATAHPSSAHLEKKQDCLCLVQMIWTAGVGRQNYLRGSCVKSTTEALHEQLAKHPIGGRCQRGSSNILIAQRRNEFQ